MKTETYMKNLAVTSTLLIFLSFLSCQQQTSKEHVQSHHEMHPGCKHEDELSKARDTFNLKLLELYNADLPYPIVITKADSLINDLKNSSSPLLSEISNFCIHDIHYFKAELYYKNRKYRESIEELKKSNAYDFFGSDAALGAAANYVKLKDYEKARAFIDSSGKGYYLNQLALGQYRECIKDKIGAIEVYQEIVNESHKHRFYYQTAILRLQELKKEKPEFLEEVIFPTMKPDAKTLDL